MEFRCNNLDQADIRFDSGSRPSSYSPLEVIYGSLLLLSNIKCLLAAAG